MARTSRLYAKRNEFETEAARLGAEGWRVASVTRVRPRDAEQPDRSEYTPPRPPAEGTDFPYELLFRLLIAPFALLGRLFARRHRGYQVEYVRGEG